MKLAISASPLIVKKINGEYLSLLPVEMDGVMPSHCNEQWLNFLKPRGETILLEEGQSGLIQAYMRKHHTEALSENGQTAFTLGQCGILLECRPGIINDTTDYKFKVKTVVSYEIDVGVMARSSLQAKKIVEDGLGVHIPTIYESDDRIRNWEIGDATKSCSIEQDVSMLYWSITGRIPGSDEDTHLVFQSYSAQAAKAHFVDVLWSQELSLKPGSMELSLARESWKKANDGDEDIYISSVICSESPIEVLLTSLPELNQ